MTRRVPGRPSVEAPARLRVRRPADFLAVIPYLVGFHPSESVVAVLCRDGRVLLTARMDLPPPELAGELSWHLRTMSRRHDVDELVLVAYSSDLEGARWLLERVVGDPPTAVRDALLVGDGRWWSLTCPAGCCPDEGRLYDLGGHPLAAEAVYAGLSAEGDRSVLARQVGGPPGAEEPQLLALLDAVRQRTASLPPEAATRLVVETVRRLRTGAGPVEDADCLLLAVLVEDLVVRDVAWVMMTREDSDDDLRLWGRVVARAPQVVAAGPLGLLGAAAWISGNGCLLLAVLVEDLVVRDVAWVMMTREDSDDDLRLWGRVVARAPQVVAAGPLGLLGAAAWISGNGALQNCCVERLEQIAPSYTLGAVLADISERALPPSAWDDMAEDLRQEVYPAALAGLR